MSSQSLQQQQRHFSLQQLLQIWNSLQQKVYNNLAFNKKINQNQQQPELEQENKLFLLFGSTSSGKTVVQYYLCRDELIYGMQEKKQLPYIIPQNIYEQAVVQKTPSTVTTRVPNIRSKSVYSGETVVFVQIPDIRQLKPQEQSLGCLFLQRVFKSFHNVHLLLVIQETSLDDGAELMQNFQSISSWLDLSNQQLRQLVASNLSVIVNKVNADSEEADVKQKLEEVNQEVLKQENQYISDVIQNIIKRDRIYVIKEAQPTKEQQEQMLQNILKNSSFISFYNYPIQLNALQQITSKDNDIIKILQKHKLQFLWNDKVQNLYHIVQYLADEKNRSTIMEQLESTLKQEIARVRDQLYQGKMNEDPLPFEGGLDDRIKSALSSFINKTILLQEYSAFNYSLNEVYNTLYEIKSTTLSTLCFNQFINKTSESSHIQSKQIPSFNKIYLRTLVQICNDLLLMILYITQILNYNGENRGEQVQVLSKECLIKPSQKMLEKLKSQFMEFDVSLLQVKTKIKGKKKTKLPKTPQSIKIIQLKQQFINQHKSKKSSSLLAETFNLPNTHFKLYLLIQQLQQNPQLKNEQLFQTTISIIKEICKILDMNQLYIEEIKFLLMVPDWNRIEEVVAEVEKVVERESSQGKVDPGDSYGKDVEFLNRLGIYAKEKRRNRLANRIFSLVDSLINQQKLISPQIMTERQNTSRLSQDWYLIYAKQLYIMPLQETKPYPQLVYKVKTLQQLNSRRIDQLNQFHYLMRQKLI